jgi:hypothetical protein
MSEEAYGTEMGEVWIEDPEDATARRQVAYYDESNESWTVREIRPVPIEQDSSVEADPAEDEVHSQLRQEDLETSFPDLWNEVRAAAGC